MTFMTEYAQTVRNMITETRSNIAMFEQREMRVLKGGVDVTSYETTRQKEIVAVWQAVLVREEELDALMSKKSPTSKDSQS